MAKFGYLFLRKGKWGTRQLVPESWIEASTSKQIDTPHGLAGRYGYGYQWWMNPFGGYSARGFGGQYIFVVPQYDLIVVTTAGLEGGNFFLPESLVESFVIPAIQAHGLLPENKESCARLSELVAKFGKAPLQSAVVAAATIARNISGRRYLLDDKSTVSLDLDNPAEAVLKTDSPKYGLETLRIGLDGIWRINENLPEGPLPADP